MTIQKIIEKALSDKEYRKALANSFGINSNFKCTDCALEERMFILFLRKCRWNYYLNRIFKNIDYLIINKENVTDRVFKELVKYAKTRKGRWLWVSLTHANLNEAQQAYLRSLPFLNEAVFY